MKRGFTLAEILIVVSLIMILAMMVLVNVNNQINKGYDARRKSDLNNIHKAFDEYFNDHECFPPLTILDHCGSADFTPYMSQVPCDPQNQTRYIYRQMDPTDLCAGFRVLASLRVLADPDIPAVGCSPTDGCGFGVAYNWGVSEGGPVGIPIVGSPSPSIGPSVSPPPTPTPLAFIPPPGTWACTPAGLCNNYSDAMRVFCTTTFADTNCLNMCANDTYRCSQPP